MYHRIHIISIETLKFHEDTVVVTPINAHYLLLETALFFYENDLGAMWILSWMWGINDTYFAMCTNYHFSTNIKLL